MDLKIKDVAELLNVSETTIRRWLAEGKIPAYRMHHQYRFSRIEIENWVMSCKMNQGRGESQEELGEKKKGSGTQQFSLLRALNKGIVLDGVEGKTKEEVIRNSMEEIAKELKLDADVIVDLLLDRENMMPTSLGRGIGVPHTRDFLLKEGFDVVAVVYPKKPIPYGALDNIDVDALFFLFACEDKRHLHLLAKIAHLITDPEGYDFLKSHPTKPVMLEFIKKWEAHLTPYASALAT